MSICIPVYNEDVRNLTLSLVHELQQLKINAEILLYDDYSRDEIREMNRELSEHSGVRYKELPENVGRSAIRNKLGKEARGEYLLFLDCDSLVTSGNFIQNYMDCASVGHIVVIGGTLYPDKAPGKENTLHWKYGARIESSIRKQATGRSHFHSNNFLIRKDVFCEILFNEKLSTYGHEDTFFGFELRQAGITVYNIDNPVLHNHLESNEIFIKKTEKALLNLLKLNEINPGFRSEVKLLQWTHTLHRLGLTSLITHLFRRYKQRLYHNLTGDDPSLFCFNLYRLGFLAERTMSLS